MIAPVLFVTAIDYVLSALLQRHPNVGPRLWRGRVPAIAYADDVTLLAESWADAQTILNSLVVLSAPLGLTVNATKTKSLELAHSPSRPIITMSGSIIDYV